METILKTLRALSGETRIKLIKLLQEEELCVCELEYILGLSQPAISQQVKILKDAGIANSRREGNWVYYRIDSEDLRRAFKNIFNFFYQESAGGEAPDGLTLEWELLEEIKAMPGDMCPRIPEENSG